MLIQLKNKLKIVYFFVLSFMFIGCMSAETSKFTKREIDYDYVNNRIKSTIPKAEVIEVDTNQIIQLKAWRPIKNAEYEEDINVDVNTKKYHIIKHTETALINTYWQAVVYKYKDSLHVGIIAPMGDPKAKAEYILGILDSTQQPIKNKKSSTLYLVNTIVSPTLANWYLLHNNPLFTSSYKKKSLAVHFVGDFATLIAVLSFKDIIEKDSPNKPIGKLSLSLAFFSRLLTLFESGYLIEYNRYAIDKE